MAEINYDKLVIGIEVNSKNAHDNIDKLSSSLKKLDTQAEKLELTKLREVKELLQEISNIRFDNITGGLWSLARAVENFSKDTIKAQQAVADLSTQELPEMVSDSSTSKTEKVVKSFKDFNAELSSIQASLKPVNMELGNIGDVAFKVGDSFRDITLSIGDFSKKIEEATQSSGDLEDRLAELGLNGTQIAEVFNALGKETNRFTQADFEKVKKGLMDVGYSAKEAEKVVKQLKEELEKSGKQQNNLTKAAKKFGSLAVYRVMRLALQAIQKQLGEAIKELATVDSEFNKSISGLMNSFKYLTNSLVAMFAPIIKIVSPIIEFITDSIGDLANMVGELLAGVAGQDTFSQAIKGADDYAESLKKVKSQTLGIDELNVLQADEDKTSFETKDIETMGNIGEMFSNIREELTPVIDAVKNIFVALKPLIQLLGTLVSYLLESTSGEVHKSLEEFANMIASIVGFITDILTDIKPLLDFFNIVNTFFLNLINTSLTTTFRFVSKLLKLLGPILKILEPICAILTVILDVVMLVIGGISEGISGGLSTLIEFIGTIFATLGYLLSGQFDKIGGLWDDLGKRLKEIWANVGNFFVDILNNICNAFKHFMTWIVNALNSAIKWISDVSVSLGGNPIQIPTPDAWGWKDNPIPRFVNGGFPEDGFFLANHNELVGQFDNGRTAVANNQQITDGIYRAVKEAMASSNGGAARVYLDGKEITNRVNQINQNAGGTIYKGGVLSYGK